MGLRFRKTIKIAPGVKLNLNKKSTSISLGGKVAGVTFNSRTGAHARVSAPGTGLSYTTKIGGDDGGNAVARSTRAGRREKNKKPFYKKWWFWCLVILLLIAMFSPGDGNAPDLPAAPVECTSTPEPTAAPTEEPMSTPKSTVEPEETPSPTSEPLPTETPAPTAEHTPEPTMVWISESGERYHRNSSCSNMNSPWQITIDDAEDRGYTPCGKCY